MKKGRRTQRSVVGRGESSLMRGSRSNGKEMSQGQACCVAQCHMPIRSGLGAVLQCLPNITYWRITHTAVQVAFPPLFPSQQNVQLL